MDEWLPLVFIVYYIDCFINVAALYLRFAFANWMYDRVCSRVHQGLICWVTKCIQYKLSRNVSEVEPTSDDHKFTLTIELSTKERTIKFMSSDEGSTPTETIPAEPTTPMTPVTFPTTPVTPMTPMSPCSPVDSAEFDLAIVPETETPESLCL